jgi:TRAP transporter 4TM/12TM fusion protein
MEMEANPSLQGGMTPSIEGMCRWLKDRWMDLIYIGLTFYVGYNYLWPLPTHQALALFCLLVFVGLFLRPRPPESSRWIRRADFFLAALSIVCFGYVVMFHYEIASRQPLASTTDIVIGVIGTAVVLEGTRRGFGWLMMSVVSLFLLYFFLGQHLPVQFGGHAGYYFDEVISALYLSTVLDGIFGSSTYVFFNYIFLFFLFGNILSRTGATVFLMNLVRSVVGTTRGGAAMVAVTGSGAVGSITGSSMANVMITGVVTIPMMKRTGFKPHVAAGIEAVASSGGQIMPPVMGAVSFLMMNFLGVPYIQIIKAAVIPALLFYLAVLASVYFYSHRVEVITGVEASEVPKLREVLRMREGLTFLGGFTVLLTLMVMKFSPMLAVMAAIITAYVLSFITPSRMTLKKTIDLMHDTSLDFVGLGAVGAGIGIVIAATLQSGLAFRATSLIMNLSGGNLIGTLICVFFACFFLGMGLPPIVIYIISVLVAAPSLIQLGVPPMAAHLFCFYAAICCELNPPIATAAMAASLVAKSNFWLTCNYSMLFGVSAHLLAFSFAIDPSMILLGTFKGILFSVATATAGVMIMSWGICGPFRGWQEGAARIIIFFAGVLLVLPGVTAFTIAGILILIGVPLALIEHKRHQKRLAATGSTG